MTERQDSRAYMAQTVLMILLAPMVWLGMTDLMGPMVLTELIALTEILVLQVTQALPGPPAILALMMMASMVMLVSHNKGGPG